MCSNDSATTAMTLRSTALTSPDFTIVISRRAFTSRSCSTAPGSRRDTSRRQLWNGGGKGLGNRAKIDGLGRKCRTKHAQPRQPGIHTGHRLCGSSWLFTDT
jgi:hypothetical protein